MTLTLEVTAAQGGLASSQAQRGGVDREQEEARLLNLQQKLQHA